MNESRRIFPSPIPSAGIPRRGLFVDRWGTLLHAKDKAPVRKLQDARFSRGALEALFRSAREGWDIYLIGNEDAVAFGQQSPGDWKAFEDELLEHLRAHGIAVKRCYACLEHPQGVKGQARDSVFLLPNTGLFYHAAQFDGISLKHSWVVGDGTLELVAGWRAGCHIAGLGAGEAFRFEELCVEPDLMGPSLASILAELRVREPIPESP